MAECDVLDVDEHFVAALLVPDLAAGVAGVLQDGAHCQLRPRAAASLPVTIPCRVVRGRRGDPVSCEPFGDRVQAAAADELGEDPLHHRRCNWVRLETAQSLTDRSFRRVRMGSRVREHIAVRGSAAEEAALDRGLCGHRGANACLDPVAFALAHASVEAHDEIVRVGAGVDRAADLGHPQLDAVVHEHGERESELVAVERALRFADDDGVPAAARSRNASEQA